MGNNHLRRIIAIALIPGICCIIGCRLACAAGPYCGVYSLYGAAQAIQADVKLEKLIDARYISSKRGSSVQDLRLAADENGFHATPLIGLGRRSLQHARDPLILHVAPRGTQGEFTHWILFLGMSDGKALIYDGPGGVVSCSIDDVLARWDGKALAVHEGLHSRSPYVSLELAGLLLLALAGLVLTLVVRLLHRALEAPRRQTVGWQMGVMATVACCAGYVWCANSGDAGERNSARAGVSSALGLVRYPTVGRGMLASWVENSSAYVIDCRYDKDFALGHLPGAISLPINAGLGEFRKMTGSLPRDQLIVVYCQSRGCRFSDYTAAMLAAEGFTNFRIYRNGYSDWQSS